MKPEELRCTAAVKIYKRTASGSNIWEKSQA